MSTAAVFAAVLAGLLAFPLSEATSVMAKFEKLSQDGLPLAFSGDGLVANNGTDPPALMFYFHYILSDGRKEAEDQLKTMRSLGTVVMDTVEESEIAPNPPLP